jgi:hypothetical protein
MVFQALGVPCNAVVAMLSTIQDMKFFLRTGFGDSKEHAGSTGGKKTQGLCQGNGAAPAGWTVTSITMIQAHKKKGHGVHLFCLITKTPIHLTGTLFVDDTNLEHLDMNNVEMAMEALRALQTSIASWGQILIATGGALKPEKCFYHLTSFSWKSDGSWQYEANEKCLEFSIMVPLGDGSFSPIAHLPVTAVTKTLDQMTCPTGSSAGAIAQMQDKAQKWVDKAKAGKLNKRYLTFLLDKQF